MDGSERILIVDDDESTRSTLKLILGRKGYQAVTAGTGIPFSIRKSILLRTSVMDGLQTVAGRAQERDLGI